MTNMLILSGGRCTRVYFTKKGLSAPDGPHAGPMNLAIWDNLALFSILIGITICPDSLCFFSNLFVCWRITASDPVEMQINITDIDILHDDDDDHNVYLKDGKYIKGKIRWFHV